MRMPTEVIAAFILLGAVPTTAHRPAARRSSRRDCTFLSFEAGNMHEVSATPDNIVFKRGDIIVVQEPTCRTMVRYTTGNKRICQEMSGVTCLNFQNSKPELNGPCIPDPRPSLGYIRSMIGAVPRSAWQKPSPHVLVIGLGAQSLTVWLQQSVPHARVDAVDIDSAVIAATALFGITKNNVNIVESDGRAFLEGQPDGSYDVIFVDAYEPGEKKNDDERMVPSMTTVEFFRTARTKLAADGIISLNVWEGEDRNVEAAMLAAFDDEKSLVQKGSSPGLGNIIIAAQVQGTSDSAVKEWTDLLSWRQEAEFERLDRQEYLNRTALRFDADLQL